jgi:hypothetical protein
MMTIKVSFALKWHSLVFMKPVSYTSLTIGVPFYCIMTTGQHKCHHMPSENVIKKNLLAPKEATCYESKVFK